MKYLLLFFGLFLASLSWSQNYQTINSKDINYFESVEANYFLATRIDSIQIIDTDSVFYSFMTHRDGPSLDTCEILIAPCWLGEKVIIKSDGYNLFFNSFGDTISINTQAELNDTFTVYNYPTGGHVKGWVSSIEEEEILGVLDSVKTISLFSNNDEFNLIDPEFKIGKESGFTAIYPFYSFPQPYQPEHAEELMNQPLKIAGSEFPRVGITKNTNGDIHDHEVGDKIIYSDHTNHVGYFDSHGHSRITESLFTDKFYIGEDTLVYKIESKSKYSTFTSWDEGTGPFYASGESTKIVTNLEDKAIPGLPEECRRAPGQLAQNSMSYTKCGKLTETIHYLEGYGTEEEDDTTSLCLFIIYMGINDYNESKIKGLGGTFLNGVFYEGDNNKYVSQGIPYYSDSDGECGTNFSLNTKNNKIENDFSIYPNPSLNQLMINYPSAERYSINIFSSTGELVFSKEFNSIQNKTQVQTSEFQTGIYFIQITTENTTLQKQFIKI